MIDLKNLSNRDIIQMQYNLLEELKTDSSKPIVNDVVENTDCWNYINQRFADNNGHLENDTAYLTRLKWFDNNCCKLKKLAELSDVTYKTIRKFSSRYDWKNIRHQAVNLGYAPKHTITVDVSKPTVKRDDPKYYQFRQSVLNRDKVCQCCGSKEDLEVHHLFSFNAYNHLGADPKNGIALCKECHKRYHSQYGTKKHNNPVTLAQFLRDYGMNTQTSLDGIGHHISANAVYKNIKEFEEDYGECSIEKLVTGFMEFGFSENSVRTSINHLVNKGLCYYPSKGVIRTVD